VANDPGVPAAPVLNKSTIYYVCDSGNTVPIRVSGTFMDVPINGCQLTLNLNTSTEANRNFTWARGISGKTMLSVSMAARTPPSMAMVSGVASIP
jgi:hypothetical protein